MTTALIIFGIYLIVGLLLSLAGLKTQVLDEMMHSKDIEEVVHEYGEDRAKTLIYITVVLSVLLWLPILVLMGILMVIPQKEDV